MNVKLTIVVLGALITRLLAQSPDPISEGTFPPELLMFYQSEIGLSDETRNELISQIQKAAEKISDLERLHKKEVEGLADFLKSDRVDEKTALSLLDNVLDRERELKRTHLSLVVGMRNKLTPEEYTKLLDIKKRVGAGELLSPEQIQKQLQEKVEQVQQGVEQWQNDGRDPSPIAEIMQEFEPLMKEGKHKEAEEVLISALKRLNEK